MRFRSVLPRSTLAFAWKPLSTTLLSALLARSLSLLPFPLFGRYSHLAAATLATLVPVCLRHDSKVFGTPQPLPAPPAFSSRYHCTLSFVILHLAVTLGRAEFYPFCTQIRIGGPQTGTPNQTVFFPGAYNDNDPGIYDPNIYSPGAPYTFSGGPVSNLASPAD
jgi:hypothetical protein